MYVYELMFYIKHLTISKENIIRVKLRENNNILGTHNVVYQLKTLCSRTIITSDTTYN